MSDFKKTKAQLIEELNELREALARRQQVETISGYNQQFLQSILDNYEASIYVIDRQGRFLLVNKTFATLFGLDQAAVIGKTDYDIFPPDTAENYQNADLEVLKAGLTRRVEETVVRADGLHYYETIKFPLFEANGQPYALCGISTDITDRKRAEESLAKRAVELEMVAQVSIGVSTNLDADKLLQDVVDLTKKRFGLYHAHIYLLNEPGDTLNLMAGAGEVGRQMVAQGWQIPFDREQSLVAQAARTQQGVIVNDVHQDPHYFQNPLLPDTRSEMAVPVTIGDKLLGVLDVQSDQANYFTAEDVQIYTTLAAQIAVALQNATLYAQTQVALTEIETLYDLSAELNRVTTLEEALQVVVLPGLATGVHYANLFTLEMTEQGKPEWLTIKAGWGELGQITAGVRVNLLNYPMSKLWIDNPDEPLMIGDVYNDERVDAGVQQEYQQLNTQAFMIIPLRIGNAWIGGINICWPAPRIFTQKEQRLYKSLAAQLAVVVNNQLLLEQTQQRAEELEEATQFLDSIVDNIPTMVFVKEAEELRFVRWNKVSEEIFGFRQEDVLGKNDYDLVPKEEADFFTAKDREVFTKGELLDIPEEPIHTADGTLRLLHTRKVPIFDREGQPKYLLGISEDITERKQAEAALHESRERYEVAVLGSNDGLWDWNLITNDVYFSPRWKSIIGYEDHELANDFAEFESRLHPEDHDRVLATVADYLEGRISTYEVEFRHRHKDGSYRWVLARGMALRDATGKPYRMAGSHTDITPRKQFEEILTKRAVELETVAQVSAAASTVLNVEKLLQEVVDLTKDRFGLYHAHIYLLDVEKNMLELTAGAGEIGRQMVWQGWQIPLEREQSLVARVARTRQGVIVNNVREAPDWLPNPLLPDTQAELAAPLIVGNRLLGVLDVQSERIGYFTDEDLRIQMTLASQVAVALQNARQYEQTQRRAERERLVNRITQKIQSTATVDSALQVAIQELGRAFEARATRIQLMTAKNDELDEKSIN